MEKEQKPRTYNKERYLDFYKLSQLSSIHHSEKVPCHEKVVFTQSFLPSNRRGIAIILHGYLDHSGALAEIIRFLVGESYGVITFDLPGHGHSSGPRGDIQDFEEYSEVLQCVLSHFNLLNHDNEKIYAVGHSTGAAILLEHLFQYASPFSKIILAAPLVHPYMWSISKHGIKFMGNRIKHLKRRYRKNSSNEAYLQFVQNDPLQYATIPINWLRSLSSWDTKVQSIKPRNEKLHIIQGTEDTTVNWKHNLSFLIEKFPKSNPIIIDKGDHQLFNEESAIKELTFFHIKRILQSTD